MTIDREQLGDALGEEDARLAEMFPPATSDSIIVPTHSVLAVGPECFQRLTRDALGRLSSKYSIVTRHGRPLSLISSETVDTALGMADGFGDRIGVATVYNPLVDFSGRNVPLSDLLSGLERRVKAVVMTGGLRSAKTGTGPMRNHGGADVTGRLIVEDPEIAEKRAAMVEALCDRMARKLLGAALAEKVKTRKSR